MKRLFLLLSLTTLFFIFSCSGPEDLSQTESISDGGFYALKVGNSWVYKHYQRNPFTEEYEENEIVDSVSIVGTEEISGEIYFKFRTFTTGNDSNNLIYNLNGESFELLREDNGNLIDETGIIKFTNNNFEERVIGTSFSPTIFEILIDETATITTEAGEFHCIYSERFARSDQGVLFDGRDRFYYSEGIGLIENSLSTIVSGTIFYFRRLVSFSVQ